MNKATQPSSQCFWEFEQCSTLATNGRVSRRQAKQTLSRFDPLVAEISPEGSSFNPQVFEPQTGK